MLIVLCLIPVSHSITPSKAQAKGNSKVIYLTLDADMSSGMAAKLRSGQVKFWYDPQLIKYLQDEQVPTTFFVSGLFAQEYPDLMKSLATNSLFSIQNHSYDESGFTAHCYRLHALITPEEKINQIKKTQDILIIFTGKKPVFFRFPGLCKGKADIPLVQTLGLKINEGDVIASDPFNRSEKQVEHNVLNNLKDRGVIVMHIGGPNAPQSLNVLKKIIPKIKELNYNFALLQ